ncbi:uncharacterized protein BDR25DRAFT_71735 [Lindgomyces ingoldianus]|uniref:Uncharacterized protein n=1 Tax=Lindgomyces ingoldianus TaxID=673940 RepID=A0ACB6QJ36_9PLEO|nr:uncharacterized protein BDR25DRAFT_71735 [Lindgomyces ingoldianus]KAF2466959.1 hypothetical protein BDR25DRAFT_71735 [Lindgomyces ingoldianus]
MAPIPISDVPPTWANHGDKNLICIPAQWTSVILFCFANYLAHCATVKPYPAETLRELGIAMGLALVLPSSGITRAVDSIIRRSNFRKLNQLEKAATAGALCMVIRDKYWSPQEGEVLRDEDFVRVDQNFHYKKKGDKNTETVALSSQTRDSQTESLLPTNNSEREATSPVGLDYVALETITQLPSRKSDDIDSTDDAYCFRVRQSSSMRENIRTSQHSQSITKRQCQVHGAYELPKGYTLGYVPSDAEVLPYIKREENNELQQPTRNSDIRIANSVHISSSYSFTKAAIAIVQTVYASTTLYRARGDQVRIYGYAAFGLTVVPYVLMSILNLIGQIASSEYPTLYMVHTDIMDEAKKRGGIFDGVVGSLTPVEGPQALRNLKIKSAGPWTVSTHHVERGYREQMRIILRSSESDQEPQEIQMEASRTNPLGYIYIGASRPFARRTKKFYPRAVGEPSSVRKRWASSSYLLNLVAPVVFGCISLLIVGVISRFQKGKHSTSIQRGFTMSWLIIGMLFGAVTRAMHFFLSPKNDTFEAVCLWMFFPIVWGIFLVPALGGIVVVCQMIVSYGSCTRIA